MVVLKMYKKEKEGKLQRLPVKHVDSYHIDISEDELITIRPKTRVIHGSSLEEVPLQMVKKATMVKNPFLEAMEEKYKQELVPNAE